MTWSFKNKSKILNRIIIIASFMTVVVISCLAILEGLDFIKNIEQEKLRYLKGIREECILTNVRLERIEELLEERKSDGTKDEHYIK